MSQLCSGRGGGTVFVTESDRVLSSNKSFKPTAEKDPPRLNSGVMPMEAILCVYDREHELASRLNNFFCEQLGLPEKNYYAQLGTRGLAELKFALSDVNNLITLKACLSFGDWLARRLELPSGFAEQTRSAILRTPPNSNGYDLEITKPVQVIAEVKCNIPINHGSVFGAAQRNGIVKDIDSLVSGKRKSAMKPHECIKFIVLLDTSEVRAATSHLLRNLRKHQGVAELVQPATQLDSTNKVYVVHVPLA